MSKIDTDVFINEFIRELDDWWQQSSDVTTPFDAIWAVLQCAKFARSKATKE